MLPPVLEIFVVWHPEDREGVEFATAIFRHFLEGRSFLGVIGGGINVSFRSEGWTGEGTAPRPIYTSASPAPNGIPAASFVAIVPLMGSELSASVAIEGSPWRRYVETICDHLRSDAGSIGLFPFLLPGQGIGRTLAELLGASQRLATGNPSANGDHLEGMLCRDLTQGIAQLVSPDEMDRLTVFLSHTKRNSEVEQKDVEALIGLVRKIIADTRLKEYFDANDLQPGKDWKSDLERHAATSAMLALRTDLYSSREWCQREVMLAKINGMPLVMVDAMNSGEERGSFLMDHVPRVAIRQTDTSWKAEDVIRALNLLVDECLKRALWMHQKKLAIERPELQVAWWAPHAPEPITLAHWLEGYLNAIPTQYSDGPVRILHPDPPLGPSEREALEQFSRTSRLDNSLDIMTPRQLATRGG